MVASSPLNMPISKVILEPGRFYHIYCHAVSRDNLYYSDRNYIYFISKIEKYLIEYVDIYSYCLMPNHYHILFYIPDKYGNNNANDIIVRQISKMLNSYAQAINKQEKRMGSLFAGRFKRIHVGTEEYLKNLIIYIHQNPVASGFSSKISYWKYSSYNSILKHDNTLVKTDEVIELFNDLDNFKYCHQNFNNKIEI